MTTTIEDLQALVAQSILSTEAFKNQLAASQEVASRLFQEEKAENARRAEAADHSLEAFKAQLAASQEAADRRAEEAAEDSRRLKQRIDDIGKQVGGLNNKFGTFAEGLFLPSVKRILRKDLGLEYIAERMQKNRKIGGVKTFMELDAFGYSNGSENVACIVEIKSHLRLEAIEQIQRQLKDFPEFFPDHANKCLYGMIAAVDAPQDIIKRVLDEGLYLSLVEDDVSKLVMPEGFVPKDFGKL
ncbi:MAG: DUF3782 domain-containing protein [Candidatus Kapaibacteriota bacterium]|jgi:hypothetical protein